MSKSPRKEYGKYKIELSVFLTTARPSAVIHRIRCGPFPGCWRGRPRRVKAAFATETVFCEAEKPCTIMFKGVQHSVICELSLVFEAISKVPQ
jgi:hypothetical protein